MAKRHRGPTSAPDAEHRPRGERGGFLGQLGLVETGSGSPGLFGIALAIALAVLTYPLFWLVRALRRRGSR